MKKIILLLLIVVLCGCQSGSTESKKEKYAKATNYALEGEYEKAIDIYENLNNYENSESVVSYIKKISKIDISSLNNVKEDTEISAIYDQIMSIKTSNDTEKKIANNLENECINAGIDLWINKIFEDINNKTGIGDFHGQPFYDRSQRYNPVNNVAFEEFYYWFGDDKNICEWGNSYNDKVDYEIFDLYDKNYDGVKYLQLFEDNSKPADKKFENLYSALCYYNAIIKYPQYHDINHPNGYTYDIYVNLCRISPDYNGPNADKVIATVLANDSIKTMDSWKESHEHEAVKEYTFTSKKNIDKLKKEAQAKSDEEFKEQKSEQQENQNYDPKIGMTKEEIRNSKWGEPDKINKDEYAWGTSEQWVYRNRGYIYFKNGIVTSIQHR